MTPKRCVHSTGIALRNWCIEMARTHTDLLIDIDFILIPYSFIPLLPDFLNAYPLNILTIA
jgi:hypothetical protein